MALAQSVGQGLTFTGLLIFALSNSNPARATAFVAYIQVMRLDVIEVATTAVTTWLRVREQLHSHLIGLHLSAGDSEVAQALARLTGRFAGYGAAAETALRAPQVRWGLWCGAKPTSSLSSTALKSPSGPQSLGSC